MEERVVMEKPHKLKIAKNCTRQGELSIYITSFIFHYQKSSVTRSCKIFFYITGLIALSFMTILQYEDIDDEELKNANDTTFSNLNCRM